jgi:glucan phosphoethanolaminetransferase (alkaline phosphatase superfamily)
MKWLAFYYIVFFTLLYFARNWLYIVFEEDYIDASDGLTRFGLHVLLWFIFISSLSYALIVFCAIANQFLGLNEESQSGTLIFYLCALIFTIPLTVTGKILYELGYERGLKDGKRE